MNFCTYFDSKYLNKAFICRETLLKQNPNSILYSLCFDDYTYKIMSNLSNVIPIFLQDIENEFPELLNVKQSRLSKEYYATISPILPLYIFKKYNIQKLFYTDADMAFWSNPQEIEDIMGDNSILVTDHGFEPPRAKIRFNVGILGYKNDNDCNNFLNWWKDKCLDWCKWETTEDGGMADQGYLNILHDQPGKFGKVISCPQPGINLGPWNAWRYNLSTENNKILLNNKFNLVCYHYHEFKLIGNSYNPTGWKLPNFAKELIYDPYFNLIKGVKV